MKKSKQDLLVDLLIAAIDDSSPLTVVRALEEAFVLRGTKEEGSNCNEQYAAIMSTAYKTMAGIGEQL